MKTKRHHNSFRPDLGFFIPLQEVQSWLQTDEASLRDRVAVSRHLLLPVITVPPVYLWFSPERFSVS